MTKDIRTLLSANPYPGRGILIGRTSDGACARVLYFIMGRSANSRNRVFEKTEDGIRTRAFDESKMEDPSLIIYHPVRFFDGKTVVTNGDQTDTIRDFMQKGHCYRHALLTRTFEPDGPNWTPRISGVVKPSGGYVLSILKSADGDGASCERLFFEYDEPLAGRGHFISTYQGDGNPLPSFKGEPIAVSTEGDFDGYCEGVWEALDAANKVSLYALDVNIGSGERRERIFNKNLGD